MNRSTMAAMLAYGMLGGGLNDRLPNFPTSGERRKSMSTAKFKSRKKRNKLARKQRSINRA